MARWLVRNGDELLARLDSTIRLVVDLDLPDIRPAAREQLVGHLTGAVFVTTVDSSEEVDDDG